MKSNLILYSLLFVCFGCDQLAIKEASSTTSSTTETSKSKAKEGLMVNHRPDGEVLSEINYKDQKKDGLAKSYYKDGSIHQEINYKGGLKDGDAITYYENGKIFRSTPYKAGKIDGVQKKYRENGELMAEVPYKNDQPGKGLKEYLVGGKLKTKYPEIVIKPIDNIIKENSYHLRISLSQNLKKAEFFVGDLKGGYLPLNLPQVAQKSTKGEYQLDFFVPPGAFLMQKVNIICKATTLQGNPYILEKSFNIAVENKGY